MTGQTWRDAVWQYKTDRDPDELIFRFKARSLVHFAVDPDEVYMTTRLAGKATSFLPFNKGDGDGRRQPAKPRRLQDRLPLGAGAGARQPHGHPRPLPAPRDRREDARRQEGRTRAT